jgi:hypothetical protein
MLGVTTEPTGGAAGQVTDPLVHYIVYIGLPVFLGLFFLGCIIGAFVQMGKRSAAYVDALSAEQRAYYEEKYSDEGEGW